MAISKIIVETCAGGSLEETVAVMIDMAERYKCNVQALLNGTLMVVGPNRLADVMQLWELKRQAPPK